VKKISKEEVKGLEMRKRVELFEWERQRQQLQVQGLRLQYVEGAYKIHPLFHTTPCVCECRLHAPSIAGICHESSLESGGRFGGVPTEGIQQLPQFEPHCAFHARGVLTCCSVNTANENVKTPVSEKWSTRVVLSFEMEESA